MAKEVLCRLCATEGSTAGMILLYDESMECTALREKIEKYTPIKLDKKLSEHVCTSCSDFVNKWDTFCKKCENAEMLLAQHPSQQLLEKDIETVPSVQQIEIRQRGTKTRYSYCVAKWCNSNNMNCPYVFRIPKGARGREWLERAERKDLLHLNPDQLSRKSLCSKHFTKDNFLRPNKLKWNAMPTIFKTHKLLQKNPTNSTLPDQYSLYLKDKWRPVLPAPVIDPVSPDIEHISSYNVSNISEKTVEKTSNLDLQTQELQSEGTTSVDCTSLTDIINAIIDDQVTFTLEPYDLNGVNCITNPLTTTSIHCQSTDSIASHSFSDSVIEQCTEKPDEIHYPTVKEMKQVDACVSETTKTKDIENSLILQDTSEGDIVRTAGPSVGSANNKSRDKLNSKEGLEMLNELESLYSEQSFQESVESCSACGEVFLMKSSLLHHQKRYHTEHFEANSMS